VPYGNSTKKAKPISVLILAALGVEKATALPDKSRVIVAQSLVAMMLDTDEKNAFYRASCTDLLARGYSMWSPHISTLPTLRALFQNAYPSSQQQQGSQGPGGGSGGNGGGNNNGSSGGSQGGMQTPKRAQTISSGGGSGSNILAASGGGGSSEQLLSASNMAAPIPTSSQISPVKRAVSQMAARASPGPGSRTLDSSGKNKRVLLRWL